MSASDRLGHRIAKGASWAILQRLAVRVIGLASTIVLARLLVPADFGIVALATTVMGLLDTVAELGFDLALIQNQKASRQDYDTAWTLTVARGVFCALVLVAVAQPIAHLYDDPRLSWVMVWLALGSIMTGLQNIGIVDFRKELRLDREFSMLVWSKVAGFVVTLPLAWLLRDHRALVAGILASKLIALVMSYRMHPYRPRLTMAGWRGYFHFSKWLLVSNVVMMIRSRLDTFVVGKVAGTELLGIYNVAYEISSLTTTELISPISRAIFPGFAKMVDDRDRLAGGFVDVLGFIFLFGAPMALGIGLTAEHVVRIFLGENWLAAIPVIQILTIYGIVNFTSSNSSAIYLARRRADMMVLRSLPTVIVLPPALILGTMYFGLVGAAWALVFGAVVAFVVNFALLRRELGFSVAALFGVVWRPAIGAGAMSVVVLAIIAQWPVARAIPAIIGQLAVIAAAGASTYVASILALWALSGQPRTAERHAIDVVAAWLDRRRKPA